MSVETFDLSDSIRVTDAAARHFAYQLKTSGDHSVRISLKTSGCNGFAYVIEGIREVPDQDLTISLDNGVTLYIDREALPALQGTEIDYVREGINSALKFNNPNIKEECGCGESFTI